MENRYITVIVTVYNTAKYLDKFFNDMSRQTFTDYELLMIDDGSEDNSLEICRRYAETDPRIRVISKEHIGISAARNLAFGELHTEFATSLDTDDPFEPDYLKHLIDAQKKYNADLVISNVVFQNETGLESSRFVPRREAFYKEEAIGDILPDLLDEGRLNYLYGKIYRTEYLKDVSVDPDVQMGSDTMIVFQYLMRCRSLAVIEDYDYYHINYSSRSVTSVKGRNRALCLYRLNKYLSDFSEENGIMTETMRSVLDKRILSSCLYGVRHLPVDAGSFPESCRITEELVNNELYLDAYRRLEEKGAWEDKDTFIEPGKEAAFLENLHTDKKRRKKRARIRRIRRHIPGFLLDAYSRLKHSLRGK